MAAAGELRCVDSAMESVLEDIDEDIDGIHFERGTEKRNQGICRSKRCFCHPSYGIR